MNIDPNHPITLNLQAKDVEMLLQGANHLAYTANMLVQKVQQQIQNQMMIQKAAEAELHSGVATGGIEEQTS